MSVSESVASEKVTEEKPIKIKLNPPSTNKIFSSKASKQEEKTQKKKSPFESPGLKRGSQDS